MLRVILAIRSSIVRCQGVHTPDARDAQTGTSAGRLLAPPLPAPSSGGRRLRTAAPQRPAPSTGTTVRARATACAWASARRSGAFIRRLRFFRRPTAPQRPTAPRSCAATAGNFDQVSSHGTCHGDCSRAGLGPALSSGGAFRLRRLSSGGLPGGATQPGEATQAEPGGATQHGGATRGFNPDQNARLCRTRHAAAPGRAGPGLSCLARNTATRPAAFALCGTRQSWPRPLSPRPDTATRSAALSPLVAHAQTPPRGLWEGSTTHSSTSSLHRNCINLHS